MRAFVTGSTGLLGNNLAFSQYHLVTDATIISIIRIYSNYRTIKMSGGPVRRSSQPRPALSDDSRGRRRGRSGGNRQGCDTFSHL
jgi:hypothetical protein